MPVDYNSLSRVLTISCRSKVTHKHLMQELHTHTHACVHTHTHINEHNDNDRTDRLIDSSVQHGQIDRFKCTLID